MHRLSWRNGLVIGATALVVSYCLAVMAHVETSPDIGLHCTFSPIVARVFPNYLRTTSGDLDANLVGCSIVEVGPYPVQSTPQYLRALRLLKDDLTAGDRSVRERQNGEDWIRVMLKRPHESEPFPVWCVLSRPPMESTVPAVIWLILEVGLYGIGALVFWKRRDDRAAGPFFAMTIMAVGAYMGGYHWALMTTQPVLLVIFVVTGLLLPAVTLHFHHVYPRPKPWFNRHPRLTFLAIYGPPLLVAAALIAAYFWVRDLARTGAPGAEIREWMRLARWIVLGAFGTAALWFLGGVACLVHSLRVAREEGERQQVRWILGGSILAVLPITYSLALAVFRPLEFVAGGASWPMFMASGFITAAFTISITRYRLLRIDLLLTSGMVYFLVSFLAGLCYYVLVFTCVLIVGSHVMPGPSLGQALWVSGSVLGLLVALDLLRGKLNRKLERHYHRDKHQLDRTLLQLSEAIEHLVEPPTLARHLLDVSAELLGVARGAVFLSEGVPTLYRLAGTLGAAPSLAELAAGCPLVDELQRHSLFTLQDDPNSPAGLQLQLLGGEVALALQQDSKMLGFLILGPKEAGFFAAEDYNVLAGLAPIAALALQGAAARRAIEGLNRELQSKVEKISEQQGRILALQRRLVRQDQPTNGGVPPTARAVEQEPGIVGSSIVVGQLLEVVRKVAASPSAVLLRGESGTGKELLARAIHDFSPRAGKAFVKVHCAALSPTLLESELFGHVKGAFTGATADKAGRFEVAHGGTLFLDEIGDITLEVQTKLLRVLQEKVIERVGSSDSVPVDVRIVAATHQNLERLIQQERFRDDLFYRLNVIPITVPPLRERREDIPELVQHFLERFSAELGRPSAEMDDEALAAIRNYPWPGNVRELRNVVERAVVLADGAVITTRELPPEWRDRARPDKPRGTLLSPKPDSPTRRARKEERLRLEREQLVRALAEARGNKAEAARALGLARSTFLSRMQKHGLQ
ncbi:MAG: sigma 54-interacting transcriptional regulator [Gemmataceae bacterium]